METDYAWAAGFIDGEGGFYIYKAKKYGDYDAIRGHLKVNQAVFREPVDRLQTLFGGSVSERQQRTITGKRVFEWQISKSEDLKRTLPLIIPYMLVKRPQAELLLELATYFKNGGRAGSPFKVERMEIFKRFCALKATYHEVDP